MEELYFRLFENEKENVYFIHHIFKIIEVYNRYYQTDININAFINMFFTKLYYKNTLYAISNNNSNTIKNKIDNLNSKSAIHDIFTEIEDKIKNIFTDESECFESDYIKKSPFEYLMPIIPKHVNVDIKSKNFRQWIFLFNFAETHTHSLEDFCFVCKIEIKCNHEDTSFCGMKKCMLYFHKKCTENYDPDENGYYCPRHTCLKCKKNFEGNPFWNCDYCFNATCKECKISIVCDHTPIKSENILIVPK